MTWSTRVLGCAIVLCTSCSGQIGGQGPTGTGGGSGPATTGSGGQSTTSGHGGSAASGSGGSTTTTSGSGGSTATGGSGGSSGGPTGSGGGSGQTGGTSGGTTGTGGAGSAGQTGGSSGATGGSGGTTTGLTDIKDGYAEIDNGRGDVNVERVVYVPPMNFDMNASLAAFQTTLYPLLQANCTACHTTANTLGSGAQAPVHSDQAVELAHQYALTRVDFRSPADSKFVTRMGTDRHHCFGSSCKDAASKMLTAVTAWANAVQANLTITPYLTAKGTQVQESQVLAWIAADQANVASADQPYIKYVSLHELQNAGITADQMNLARAAVSKALNSVARWATQIYNPTPLAASNGIVYKFDTRWYWAPNKGVTKLMFGGSDDDLNFGTNKTDYLGNPVTASVMNQKYNFAKTVTNDPSHATLVWNRVLAGNVEGAQQSGDLPPNTIGFHSNYVEASQLVYTLTRPDVYNAIMMMPFYEPELMQELGVDISQGMNSYQYVVSHEAVTIDSRMAVRANGTNGFYWKTFDVFTGQLPQSTIETAEAAGNYRFPFWANPIPKFISGVGAGGVTPQAYSFIATLAQANNDSAHGPGTTCDGQDDYGSSTFLNCLWYTGESGLQQNAIEVIFEMPNGLQAYWLGGAEDQRRVDAFTNIVRDYRILTGGTDAQINDDLGFFAGADQRLDVGSSCMTCHFDGMNRINNNLRDWIDEGGASLPTGAHGVDGWINNSSTVSQVKTLYPPSSTMRPQIENDRRPFLKAQAQITSSMVAGSDPNVYVEPIYWTYTWAQSHYKYAVTTAN
ncbi:MAG TPA: hypothetical protein VHG72_02900 [Polyangia bacterium]|nr:hypothetical protein [Polyangia bacterium]